MENVLNNEIHLTSTLEALRDDEARYQLLFESNPMPLWLYDLTTLHFIDVNPAAERFYGYTRAEFQAMSMLDVRPPDQIPIALDLIHRPERDRSVPTRFVHRKKDSTIVQVEAVSLDLTYKKRAARLAIILDVTARDQMMEELRTSEERLRLALDAAAMHPWSYNLVTGEITRDEHTQRWLLANANAEGGIFRFIHPDDQEFVSQTVTQAIQAKKRFNLEFRLLPPQAPMRWVSAHGQVICNQHGQPTMLTGVTIDVTERRQLVEELQDSEQRLRLALEAADLRPWSYDLKTGEITRDERARVRLPDNAKAEGGLLRFIHPDDQERVKQTIAKAIREKDKYGIEFRIQPPDGSLLWLSSHGQVMCDQDGEPVMLAGVSRDITGHRNLVEALEKKGNRLRIALDAAGMRVWTLDLVTNQIEQHEPPDGSPAHMPRAKEEYLAYLHPEDRPLLRAAIERAARDGAPFQFDFRVVSRAKGWEWRSVYLTVITDAHGQPHKLTGVTYDITERKQAEEKLTQLTTELQQRLTERQELMRRVVSVHEDERRRVARELHDEMGQLLAAFKLELKLLSREEQTQTPPRWQKLARLADQMGASLHQLAFQLRPAGLDHLGLLPTLHQYIDDWKVRTGISVDCQCVGIALEQRFHPELEIAIYRIVQEGLTNIVKHAQAKNVSVILETRDARQLRLIIEDDGSGFDPQAQSKMQRLGLLGMRERAELMGGSLEIESTPGGGTTLFLSLPFLAANAEGVSAHA